MPKIDIAKVPAERITSYPKEFAATVSGRVKQKIGDVAGLTQFGVNITRIKAARPLRCAIGTNRRMSSS